MSDFRSFTGDDKRRIIIRGMGLLLTVLLIALCGLPPAYAAAAVSGGTGASHGTRTTLNDAIHPAADTAEDSEATDGVIVMFRGDAELTKSSAKRMLRSGTNAVSDIEVEQVWTFDRPDSSDVSIALVTSDKDKDPDRLADKLRKRSDVKYAEKNSRVHMLSVSNDEYSDLQWSMQSAENAPNVESEWAKATGTDDVVAVVDTGINYKHPDLKDNMWVNSAELRSKGLKGKYGYDFIDGDDDPMDENGHGSHCAGIIGAVGDNGIGISGVNKQVRLMALRTLDAEGSAQLMHEIAAYNYISRAIDLGVHITAINNSWGGGDESEIFKELIDIVGAKGAVTVFAAGNDGVDIDKYSAYPADIDSPYTISVAATTRTGELATFSNYGKSVDVAAPGADILSTVSYDCYNPAIYGDSQGEISAEYNDFEAGSRALIPAGFYVNGKELRRSGNVYSDSEGRRIEVGIDGNGFSGRALRINYTGLKENDIVCAPVPYTLNEDFGRDNVKPQLSAMARMKGEETDATWGGPVFGIVETYAGRELTVSELGDLEIAGSYVTGDENYWSHMSKESFTNDDDKEPAPGDEREFVYVMYAYNEGDYEIWLDDIGMTRQDLTDTSCFGQYDYYNGTSMATPYITGAVALKRAEMQAGGAEVDVEDLINTICSMYKTEPEISTASGGAFDFRRIPAVLPPRISRAGVEEGRVAIDGSGLDTTADDFRLRITKEGQTAEVTGAEGDLNHVTFDDSGWINNVVDIEVTANGKTYTKKNIYLVDGKKSYKAVNNNLTLSGPAATDGRQIYTLVQNEGSYLEIRVYDPDKDEEIYYDPEVNLDELIRTRYEIEEREYMDYGIAVREMVYMNGALYMTVEYGAVDTTEEYKPAIYDGSAYLVKYGLNSNRFTVLDELGTDYNSAMAAYNGKLYMLGGYTVSDEPGNDARIADSAVRIYDPAGGSKKWSEGKAMPEGRYGGKALQSGGKLVYTLGHNESEYAYAPNLIFDGSKWTVSKSGFPEPINRDCVPEVGIVSGGLIYIGMPAKGIGDTFTYNIASDSFRDTGYNLIRKYSEFNDVPAKKSQETVIIISFGSDDTETSIRAAAVNKTVFAVKPPENEDRDASSFTMPVKSGFVNISRSVKGKGSISGSTLVPPGNDAKLTIKAKKGSYIKSVKVNGKKIKVKKKATSMKYTLKKLTANAKVSVVFAKKSK